MISRGSLPLRRRSESESRNVPTGRRGNTDIAIITIARGQGRGPNETTDEKKIELETAIATETATGTEKGTRGTTEMDTDTTVHTRTMRKRMATGTSALDIPRMMNKTRIGRKSIGIIVKMATGKGSPVSSSLQTPKRSFQSLMKRSHATRANPLLATPG